MLRPSRASAHPAADGRIAQRWVRRLAVVQVALMAAMIVALAADVVTQIVAPPRAGFLAFAGAAVTAVALAVVLRMPRTALVLFAVGPVAAALLGAQVTALWSISCFAAMLLTVRGGNAVIIGSVLAASNVAAGWISTGTVNPQLDTSATVGGFVAVLGAVSGAALRNHRRYVEAVEARADAAEATRQMAVERGVAAERIRIARDLHDGVGHQVAVISVHLAAAEQRLRKDPDAAVSDLVAARTAVKAVLAETQQILHVLRTDEGDSRAPVPEHRGIPALISSFTPVGLVVDAVVADLPALAADRSAALYRIVQEALTNAHKHGAGSVSLRIDLDGDEIAVESVNLRGAEPASPDRHPGSGQGLIGMLERAESVGGALEAFSRDNLFWVRARIPLGRPGDVPAHGGWKANA